MHLHAYEMLIKCLCDLSMTLQGVQLQNAESLQSCKKFAILQIVCNLAKSLHFLQKSLQTVQTICNLANYLHAVQII